MRELAAHGAESFFTGDIARRIIADMAAHGGLLSAADLAELGAMIARFATAGGFDLAAFQASYAALGALRALRILGIFARLCLAEGKPKYLDLIPRVWAQLQANLSHPALSDLRTVCTRFLPAPDPSALQKMRAQCKPSP